MTGGAWRDRTYTPPGPPTPLFSPDPLSRRGEPPNYLTVYALCLVIGMVFGAVALIVVSPWLPFTVLR